VARRLEADVCSVYLTSPDLRHLTLAATKGLSGDAIGRVTLAFGEGLVGYAAERGEAVAVRDASSHPRFRYFPETREERYASLMAVPLVVSGLCTGVLVVQTLRPRDFDASDVDALQTCAQLIAPLVMNAQVLAFGVASPEERARILSQLVHSGLPVGAEATPARAAHNVEVRGSSASRGIAIGPVYLLEEPLDLEQVEYEPNPDAGRERTDLLAAVDDARRELHDVRDDVGERFGPEFAAVFNTHIQILEDRGFVLKLEGAVAEAGNGLQAIRETLAAYRAVFARIEDPFFRDRVHDVEDVARRVTAKLLGVRHRNIALSDGAIVVTSTLLPAHFALLETEKIAALVSEHGGPTSHGAIFARALEIPAVTGVAGILALARPGEPAIVDGESGVVWLSPDEALVAEFRRAQERHEVASEHLDALVDRRAETRDGRRVVLTANVGLLGDLRLCERHGAEGIGLFRTELLALAHRGFPQEDDQEKLYERVVEAMAPRPVTIRTLDLGGEKSVPNIGIADEENPQLGWRSIRLLLCHESPFRAQLRAILRASARGNVRLLLPMVSSLDELRRARALVEEAGKDLARDGVPFDPDLPVGVMIEVPSAALIADAFARECDFFSIGTNDLTQYTLAVDRGNERVAHLYDPLHPAVLTLIQHTVRAAERAGLPVSVCGEMASNPLAVPLLVGLGIGELSGTPSVVPVTKEIVRALDSSEVAEDVRRALQASTASEVHRIAAERLRKAGLLEHPDVGSWLAGVVRSALGD
jgi:phosphotransferase system enzyme I (PtsP)